jgi:4-hydroxy-4-methyl-2-oxoglutarate aldolase
VSAAERRDPSIYRELAELGTATVYEASGREGLIDFDLEQVIPSSRAAGPARIACCGQGDNLMVHAVMERLEPGEVLVLTMPEPEPVALVGELLATQAKGRGAAAILVDASVRDLDQLRELGLPVWARWIRVRGADKKVVGSLDKPVDIGGTAIEPGDTVVLDGDGVAVVARARLDEVLAASRERAERERLKRGKLEAGALSYDLDHLRDVVEGKGPDNLD